MKRYIAVIELDDDEEIVGDANISYTYRCNGTNYETDESVELKAEDEGQRMKTYEDGLNEAWKAARKIVCLPSDGGCTTSTLIKIFGDDHQSTILKQNTAAEAVAKINECENCIEVGDEVTDNDGWKGVVTRISPDGEYLVVTLQDGSALRWKKEHFKKTGRHFPQIEELLQKMQEGEG